MVLIFSLQSWFYKIKTLYISFVAAVAKICSFVQSSSTVQQHRMQLLGTDRACFIARYSYYCSLYISVVCVFIPLTDLTDCCRSLRPLLSLFLENDLKDVENASRKPCLYAALLNAYTYGFRAEFKKRQKTENDSKMDAWFLVKNSGWWRASSIS